MAFKFNSAGRKLYNKLRVSDSVILARNVTYPNAVDDSTIIGDDGTIKFLAIDEDAQPVSGKDYDPRFFSIVTTEGPEDGWQMAAHPSYFIQHAPTKRPVEEIKANASNEELLIRNQLASPADTTGDLYILAAALQRANLNITLTPAETDAMARAVKLGSVFVENRQVLAEKHDAIDAGKEPDLTAGYTTTIE